MFYGDYLHSDVFQFIETNLNKHYNRNITKNVIFLDINDFIEYLIDINEVIKELVSINDLIIRANKSDDNALNEL